MLPCSTCAIETAANTNAAQPLATDETYVYFGAYDYGTSIGQLRRVPKKGGAVETVIACGSNCTITSLKTDFENIYVRSFSGQAWAVSKAHPTRRTGAHA